MTEKQVVGADIDPTETAEWQESLAAIREFEGEDRATFIANALQAYARQLGLPVAGGAITPPLNSVAVDKQDCLSAEALQHFERLLAYIRWNAIAMVMRAGKVDSSLGGHIASFGSSAILYEVGQHFFFRGRSERSLGDLVYFQGHSSPGFYARAFLEGRLTEEHLEGFRQEVSRTGVSSYPHPWLMPDFWQFPTVSMGLGPLCAIYQAQFLKYMQNRGLIADQDRKVWAFCGDGEMNEPESLGAIQVAFRERLDNLIFVINCNLQRLDGTVWGNGQIIEQFEGVFAGAGWRVIKIRWGSKWCELFEKDKAGCLVQRFSELRDGDYQTMSARGGAYMREHFFGKDPQLAALVADLTDADLDQLLDGGHDPQQVYAAFKAAMAQTGTGVPTVILAKTVKGFGMGASGEAQNICHQQKKMSADDLDSFSKRFGLSITEKQIADLEFLKPAADSPEMKFLQQQRQDMGGYVPARHEECPKLEIPDLAVFQSAVDNLGDRELSTTMVLGRIVSILLRDKKVCKHVVPIFVDEARTFGMESYFRQLGIYSPDGQQYEPEDHAQLMYYREDKKGQVLQLGITEPGAVASWIAAGTSYAVHGVPMIPIYFYYAMYGFQRCGDLVWAAADQKARGFLFGGLSGRTSLPGEGLQHQDGQNLMMYGMVPTCVTYDPCFAYEMAVVFQSGLQRMYVDQEDVFFYITGTNENYVHPPMPEHVNPEDILKGMYLYESFGSQKMPRVQLLGSGTILREAIAAAKILQDDFSVASDVWSAVSFNELRRDIESVDRYNRLHPGEEKRLSHVAACLQDHEGPVVAATDHIKLFAEQIAVAFNRPYQVLGTNGFGRSDTRAALRDFFEMDAKMIAYTALKSLADEGKIEISVVQSAIKKLGIDVDRADPVTR